MLCQIIKVWNSLGEAWQGLVPKFNVFLPIFSEKEDEGKGMQRIETVWKQAWRFPYPPITHNLDVSRKQEASGPTLIHSELRGGCRIKGTTVKNHQSFELQYPASTM
jgi:hypothetical protein